MNEIQKMNSALIKRLTGYNVEEPIIIYNINEISEQDIN